MDKFKFIKEMYIDNNLKIFPLMANDKKPLINAWQNDCSSNVLQVAYWLENAKDCNIGLPANENNLFIIDIDMHDVNGIGNFKRLCDDLEIDEIKTLMQSTPSGGIHLIFKSDDELKKVVNSANCFKDYKGIDIRTRGYIAVEPSVINGKKYEFDTTYPISDIPQELKKFILENNKEQVSGRSDYKKPNVVEKGSRDIELFNYILNLYHNTKLDYDEIKVLAHYFNNEICVPSFNDSYVDYKVNRIFNTPRSEVIFLRIPRNGEDDNE